MARNKSIYLFLLLSLNALVSKVFFLVTFNKAHDACIKTYNVDPSDGGRCHPDEDQILCNGRMTASMTGRCADGSFGREPEITVSLFDVLRVQSSCQERDGEDDGDFSCVCCTYFQCEQSRRYALNNGARFVGYTDQELLKKYPQLDCKPNKTCYAWCSDGVWTNDESFAGTRKALYMSSFFFALIDLVVEALCVAVAFCYAVFGLCEPIKTSPVSFLVLLVLKADNDKELSYTVQGRLILVLHLIDDLVTAGLLLPFMLTLNSNNMADHVSLIYAFASSCEEVLSFLCKIRLANDQLGGPP